MTTDIDHLLATWTDAERAGDPASLGGLLTDDFIGIGPVGFTLDKTAWIDRLGPELHYDELRLDDVEVRQHGDAAIAVAHQHAIGTARGHATPTDTRVSFTIVRDNGELRIAAMQYSFIGPPPGAGLA